MVPQSPWFTEPYVTETRLLMPKAGGERYAPALCGRRTGSLLE